MVVPASPHPPPHTKFPFAKSNRLRALGWWVGNVLVQFLTHSWAKQAVTACQGLGKPKVQRGKPRDRYLGGRERRKRGSEGRREKGGEYN